MNLIDCCFQSEKVTTDVMSLHSGEPYLKFVTPETITDRPVEH